MTTATKQGRKNLKPPRPRAPLSWIQNVDEDHSFAIRQACKYHQANAVRDAQIYSDATLIERDDDGNVIIETPGYANALGWQAPRRWSIDVAGNRSLIK